MRTANASIENFIRYINAKDVYIYGIGDIYQKFSGKEVYKAIHKRVVGYIDNGKAGQEIEIFGQKHRVHGLDCLRTVSGGVILLCGTRYMEEMYAMLCGQNLPDTFVCFLLPLIWTVTDGKDDKAVRKLIEQDTDEGNEKIEKIIHCFWFSGEEKPKTYQDCIDSWKRVCPDYEIIEWDSESYDCKKNIFVKQAFEKKKWAFVSDYARLDVIYNFGGIYLDMDVELLKDFAPFLKFKAFFNFGARHEIDLGSGFGSIKKNPLIGSLLQMYEDKELLDRDGEPMVDKFVQPLLLEKKFPQWGLRMDGSMQLVDDMLLLPRRFYTPIDDFFLQNFIQCEETRGIHRYNAGWWSRSNHEQRKQNLFWTKVAQKLI